MEKILKKAYELGHLLKQNDIIKRFTELSEKLEKDEDAKKLLEELITSTREFEAKEKEGSTIEVAEKKAFSELQEKVKNNDLVNEFLATQSYYVNILSQVNEAIANPQGDPPKDSDIILPGEDKGIIIT